MKKAKRVVHYGKVFIMILVSLFVFFSVGNVVKADDYPNKPINWIISMAPGGAADQMARILAPEMEKILKTSIVIQYKVGGGGTIGYLAVSKEKPDGYTVGTYATSFFTQQYVKTGGAKISTFDFIANFVNADGCIAVPSTSPFKNLKDMFDFAQKNPQVVTIANSGTGASGHLPAAAIERGAKVTFTHVPTGGESAALTAMLGGHVSAMSLSIGGITEHVKAGKVRVLGVYSDKRLAAFPDIPTVKEQGLDFQLDNPGGLFAPKGIPENRLKMLSDAVGIGYQSDKFQKFMQTAGFTTLYLNNKQTAEMAKAYDAKIKDLCKLVGLYQE
ncbi:MAG: tripartite tricarboxylate transporter substrate binding protein [Pseudomonadota bacterium]